MATWYRPNRRQNDMLTFVLSLLQAGLRSALSAAFASYLSDAQKDPATVISDDELAKLTPQQYGDLMADDMLDRMGFPAA